jgi:tripartite-type tricarboxylate transporter receptor subunit TctC
MKKLLILLLSFVISMADAKTIFVSLPFPAGGATDRVWRTLLPMLNAELKNYNFVTDYRLGGGGVVAAEHVIAQSDTHLLFTSASIAISAANSSAVTYRADDFRLLGYFGTLPMMFVVSPELPNTMSEFAKFCQSRNLNMGSAGVGSTVHLIGDTVMKHLNCASTNISYKGSTTALPDLVSGRVDFMVDYSASATGNMAQEGKIKNIMTIGSHRLSQFSNVPTSRELGINLDAMKNWQVLLVNSRANQIDVESLQQAMQRIFSNPNNLIQFRSMGLEGVGDTPSPTFLRDNFDFYKRLSNR